MPLIVAGSSTLILHPFNYTHNELRGRIDQFLAVFLTRLGLALSNGYRLSRYHQIRRHMKHISHPLVGDVRYGKGDINRAFRERFGLHRLALHAVSVSLPHPIEETTLRIQAPIPEDLSGPLAAMGLLDRAH